MRFQIVKRILVKSHHWLLYPDGSLYQYVARGGFWTLALRLFNSGFVFLRTVVLARLLAPDDFGLFGVAMLVLSSLEALSNVGFDQALIQKKEDEKPLLNSAWTMQIIRGGILGFSLILGAPIITKFFDEPKALSIVRVLGVIELIKGIRNIGIMYFRKEMEFHKEFVYRLGSTLVDFVVALLAAIVLRSVWALVLGLLAKNVAQLLLSYLLHSFRPHIDFDRNRAGELLQFGRWVASSSVLIFLATQGDDVFLGKMLGVKALGLYQLSFQIANLASTEITHVIGRVMLPTYSKLQDNLTNLASMFVRNVRFVIVLSLPITVGLFVLSSDFVNVFLGEDWASMLPTLRILIISGFVRSVVATGGPLFHGVGKPRFNFEMNLVRVLIIAVIIYPLTVHFGIVGTAMAVLGGIIGTLPVWWYRSFRTICSSSMIGFQPILFTFLISIMMGLLVAIVKSFLSYGILEFFGCVFLGIFLYAMLSLIVWKFFQQGPFEHFRDLIQLSGIGIST